MTHSESRNQHSLKIQQLLFGYDHGHTLLAASGSGAKKRSAAILSDTDWEPRTLSGTESYLSGRPLAQEKCYALMKTWRAPEMPRPGCVWTHVLLIDEADLSRIPELGKLEERLRRPETVGKYQFYLSDLSIDLAKVQAAQIELDPNIVSDLVRLVYFDSDSPLVSMNPVLVEQAMLALWSQQWPALRRRLSFRTAPLTANKPSSKSNFDIELTNLMSTTDHHIDVPVHEILRIVTQDICGSIPSNLRRFLWRYGADTNSHPNNLIRLVQLYRELNDATAKSAGVAHIIGQIGVWYPLAEEARLLKNDITQSVQSEYSLIPELDHFEVVRAVRSRRELEAFPALGPVDQEFVNSWIAQRPAEMRSLLEATAEGDDLFADSLYSGISVNKNADFVWGLLSISESIFLRASRGSFEHLVDKRIDALTDDSLLAVVRDMKGHATILKSLIPYLLMRGNTQLISLINDEVSESVTEAIVDQVALAGQGREPAVNPNWIDCVKDRPDQVARFAKDVVQRRSQLLVCRNLLNADTDRVSLTIWATRLDVLKNDLAASIGMEFRVFLLIQALRYSEKGAEILLADAFDHVYQALREGHLPFRIELQLTDYLPHIGWLGNWDKCLRLKIAVVGVCKSLGISKRATIAITNHPEIRGELSEIWDE